jgi:hypothetical protein
VAVPREFLVSHFASNRRRLEAVFPDELLHSHDSEAVIAANIAARGTFQVLPDANT